MVKEECLAILRRSVEEWNQWRLDVGPGAGPDLSGADLLGVNLSSTDLRGADLSGTDLKVSDLTEADLSAADLSGASLQWAKLIRTRLEGANLGGSHFANTILVALDLRRVKGIEAVEHLASSSIGIDTILESNGEIPEIFLRGCGVPDAFIAYIRSLIDSPIQFYSCFISYSSRDQQFAERLYADLQSKGVRCWFAPEDLRIGDKFRPRIDDAIRVHEKLLLVLSENSLRSGWVEEEVETALAREKRESKIVLFPIRLDDAIMTAAPAWASTIRDTRHIGDFSRWKDHDAYTKGLDRLMRDLRAASSS
jgi:hypothetical protein